MNRRTWITHAAHAVAGALLPATLTGCSRREAAASTDGPLVRKTPDEWRALLTREEYRVLFEDGTERRGSSPLNDEKREGTYVCAACFAPLFTSDTKYDSGTGWPSFFAPIEGRVGTRPDDSLWVRRTEYHCLRCHGHQGHVFDDGPKPTGRRWCNNGVALRFIPADAPLPDLRT